MGQSKVNVPKAWPKKTVFFGPDMTCITESGRRSGMRAQFNEDERARAFPAKWNLVRVKKTRQIEI
jgi:hypothetical protein